MSGSLLLRLGRTQLQRAIGRLLVSFHTKLEAQLLKVYSGGITNLKVLPSSNGTVKSSGISPQLLSKPI